MCPFIYWTVFHFLLHFKLHSLFQSCDAAVTSDRCLSESEHDLKRQQVSEGPIDPTVMSWGAQGVSLKCKCPTHPFSCDTFYTMRCFLRLPCSHFLWITQSWKLQFKDQRIKSDSLDSFVVKTCFVNCVLWKGSADWANVHSSTLTFLHLSQVVSDVKP